MNKTLSAISHSAGDDIYSDWERVVGCWLVQRYRRVPYRSVKVRPLTSSAVAMLPSCHSLPRSKSQRLTCGSTATNWGATEETQPPWLPSQILTATFLQYISDDTDDEVSYLKFLNGYLKSKARTKSTSIISEPR